MKKKRFAEEQIIGILREQEAGAKAADLARKIRGFGNDALQLEGQVRRHGRLRGEAAEGARGRERAPEEAPGGSDARGGGASGASIKKRMVGPAAKREAVAHLRAVVSLSERRACNIVAVDRKTVRYVSKRPADTALRARLRDLANERRRFGYRRLFRSAAAGG